MRHCHCWLSLWFACACLSVSVGAAEPTVEPKDLPRIAPTEPAKALSTFRVKPGFRLDLVAAEPLVVDPIAMSFDEDGRLFVVEMRDYSERRSERLGRIRLLEDTDGDGRFDKSSVYVDNLPWPTAVFCYGGGVFVGATPDILFCKDTNGDGVADMKEIIFTGFASDYAPYQTNRLNVQAMLNSFNWSLDNRIHGATSMSGGKVVCVKKPGAAPVDLRGRDFSFDPRTLDFRAESGGAQHGLSFDNRGRKFVCSNSSHIQAVMYEDRYAARNPYYAMPRALVDIPVDGPAAEVYRFSPDEPWRVIRTKWRVAGLVPGPIEGGGRPSGYFTGATGVTIYRGDAWPQEFLGDAFIADCGSNLIHRKKILEHGVELRAERPPDEQKVEFIASTDNWFRPVQFANAPDGTLYVADMYREVIEHPWSLPQSIKQHLDLNSGNDRGRIYRIVPEGFKQRNLLRLSKATTAELVATLEHPNGWHRDTAARLLYERQDKSASRMLDELLASSKSLGRLHALYALNGLGALSQTHIAKALADADNAVREHGVRLAEKIFRDRAAPADQFGPNLTSLVSDPSPRVRYQLAFTLGELDRPGRIKALADLVLHDIESSWLQAAILSSLGDAGARTARPRVERELANGAQANETRGQAVRAPSAAVELFDAMCTHPRVRNGKAGQEFLRQLASIIGAQNRSADVARLLDYLDNVVQPQVAVMVVSGLGNGLQRAGSSLAKADNSGKLQKVFAQAAATATDEQKTETTRAQAAQLLAWADFSRAKPTLVALLDSRQPQVVQLAALTTLGKFSRSDIATELVQRWPSFTPRVRSEALTVLLARPERVDALLSAIEAGTIRPPDLSSTQITFLREHRDQVLRQRAITLLGSAKPSERERVVQSFLPALKLAGDATRGHVTYQNRCASCHRAGAEGHVLGPDLATVKSSGKEKMLINILDPNREVAPNYLNYLVETKDGETLLGIIAGETGTSVTLRQANGVEQTVLRSSVTRIQSQGQSAMPEGLEAGLNHQDLADLLEFLMTQN